jgi:hypothetical protein
VKKERRSKKRNERPPGESDDEDQVSISFIVKKQKIVASSLPKAFGKPVKTASKATKGTASKPVMINTFEAQSLPLSTPKIDVTKPISMILPNAQPKTVNVSSNSEETLFDSRFQELMRGSIIKEPPTASENQEVVSEENYVLNQLSSHLSGDSFTSSRMNSPIHHLNLAMPVNISIQTTTTTTIPQIFEQTAKPQQETLPPTLVVTNPELNRIIVQGRETLNNLIHEQQEPPIPSSEIQPIPPNITSDVLVTKTQHQPLTMDEIVIPTHLISQILETLTQNFVDVESPTKSFQTPSIIRSELSQIQIRTCKRPKLVCPPYKRPYQFFNNSKPNL